MADVRVWKLLGYGRHQADFEVYCDGLWSKLNVDCLRSVLQFTNNVLVATLGLAAWQ